MTAPVTIGNISSSDFVPISPTEGGWIPVEGDADARLHTLCKTDRVWSGVVTLQPCTFEYPCEHAGAIQLLEGSAIITAEGRTWEAGAGDVVYLQPGTTSTWVVREPMREFFIGFMGDHPVS
jgi:uncharacterized cupin superfamily protein